MVAVELAWNIGRDIVNWVRDARRAARTKAQQRAANIVEHAGILVAGVNRLNTQVVALLRPLVYFDPAEWGPDHRARMVRDLIAFVDESVVVPRMRTSLTALHGLVDRVAKDDVVPAQKILAMADDLIADYGHRPRSTEVADRSGTASVLFHAASAHSTGVALSSGLPRLIDLIRYAQAPAEVSELRAYAEVLTWVNDGELQRRVAAFMGPIGPMLSWAVGYVFPEPSALAPYAVAMQFEFGHLVAAQQRIFPALPAPTWAF